MSPVVPGALTLCAALLMTARAAPQTSEHLTNSLRVFNETACESDSLHMRCPHGTAIDVHSAQYGHLVSGKMTCPALNMRPRRPDQHETNDCQVTSSLMIVVDLCQDQRQCKVTADSSTFGLDPCPGTTKYLKVAYRCKPNEFQERVTCEGEEMILRCQKNKVIAVFSAMFGRSDQGHIECPVQRRVGRVCKSDRAQKKVVDTCHGQRSCNIPSDARIFGDPCVPGTPKYLRVVFTCVPKRIMKDELTPYEENLENNNKKYEIIVNTRSPPGGTDTRSGLAGQGERKERVGPGIEGLQTVRVPKQSTHVKSRLMTVAPSTQASAHEGLSSNEKLILYVVVGVLSGCLIIMVIVITKLIHDKRKKCRKSKHSVDQSDPAEEPCQTSFTLSPVSEKTYPHHTSSPADSFVADHSTDLNDTLDIMQYKLLSLTSQPPSLGRPSTGSLTRAYFRDSPNRTFHNSPSNTRNVNDYYR